MTAAHITAWSETSSDAELIASVRTGDASAFGVLYERHAAAARTVARQYVAGVPDAEDVVATAFTRVFAVLSGGGGPEVAFRAYLFTVVRRMAFEVVNASRRTRPMDDEAAFESAMGPLASTEEPVLAGFERSTVALAFRSLPERWQAILWYTEVEGQTPAAVAPVLGLSANGAAALAYRAREGLRQAYLQQHLAGTPDEACRAANPLLGAYARGGLGKRETAKVDAHLEDCGECRALLLELTEVSHGMRTVVAPLVLGVAAAGVVGTALPLWGSAAAFAGGAASGSGAGNGAAAGGSGAGSGGAATGSAAGGAGAAGTAAAGSGGLLAVLSGLPVLLVAAAGVVVAGSLVGVAALLGVFGDGPGQSASPTATQEDAGASADPQDPSTAPGDPTTPGGPGDDAAGPGGGGQDGSAAGGARTPLSPPVAGGPSSDRDGTADPRAPGSRSSAPTAPAPQNPTTPVLAVPPGSGGDVTGPGDPDAPGDGTTPVAPPLPGDPSVPADPGDPATPVDPTDPAPTDPADPTDPNPTPDPSDPADPTDPPGPPPVLAALAVDLSAPGGLVARQAATLELALTNDGEGPATDVVLELEVPDVLQLLPVASGGGGTAVPVPLVASVGAECVPATDDSADGSTTLVRCAVDEIAAGGSAVVAVDLYPRHSATVEIAAQMFVDGTAHGERMTFTRTVDPAPAAVQVDVRPVAELVAGVVGHVAVAATNTGDLDAEDVVVSVPLGNELAWHGGDGVVQPAPGSDPGWSCAVARSAGGGTATCTLSGLDGGTTSAVLLPVAVPSGAVTAAVVQPSSSLGDGPVLPSSAATLPVVTRGLSASTLLDGPLRTAQVSAPAGDSRMLSVPAGASVRFAELSWTGTTTGADTAEDLAALELTTDAGGPASWSLAGTPVLLDPAGAAGGSFWASTDVTDLVAAHPVQGRWAVLAARGTVAPGDLTWTLTVVYDVAGQPDSTVTVLSGPTGGAVPAAYALPSTGARHVSVSAVTGTEPDATMPGAAPGDAATQVNGVPVPGVVPAPPGGVTTFRTGGLVDPEPDAVAPLLLSVGPFTGSAAPPGGAVPLAAVVHASADVAAAGVLDQPQDVGPGRGVVVVDPLPADRDAGGAPVTLRNAGPSTATSVVAVFHAPPGHYALDPVMDGVRCAALHRTIVCDAASIPAGATAELPLRVTAPDGLVRSGSLVYAVSGWYAASWQLFASSGALTLADG